MLSLLAKILPRALPLLGKLGKGKATIIGDAAAVAGVVTATVSPHIVTDANIVAILHELGLVVTALGSLVAAFGFGRKAQEARTD